jgi:uncharacterized protein (DUF849 family)
MLIKVFLNGSRLPTDHVSLPLSAQELALSAKISYSLGIGVVHIHPRLFDGSQTLNAVACGEAVSAIRALCPDLPVGLSTGAWIEPDVSKRVQLVSQWTFAPDFASVNFSEEGVSEVFAALRGQGIGVEAGLSRVENAYLLVKLGLAEQCLRVLIEPDEADVESALVTVEAIIAHLDSFSIRTPRLLHGSEGTAWPLFRHAVQLGYDTRIGLEDTLFLPDGRVARDNAELVATAFSFFA